MSITTSPAASILAPMPHAEPRHARARRALPTREPGRPAAVPSSRRASRRRRRPRLPHARRSPSNRGTDRRGRLAPGSRHVVGGRAPSSSRTSASLLLASIRRIALAWFALSCEGVQAHWNDPMMGDVEHASRDAAPPRSRRGGPRDPGRSSPGPQVGFSSIAPGAGASSEIPALGLHSNAGARTTARRSAEWHTRHSGLSFQRTNVSPIR